MWKSLCSLFKKDCRMMMSGKFFLVALGSLVLYTLFINFGYVKIMDAQLYNVYLYDPAGTQTEVSSLVRPVSSLEELEFKKDFLNKPVSSYSKGMRQRVSMARALISNPKLLFLDEPTSGLDPAGAVLFRKIIEEERQKGTTVFLTTHNMLDADLLCDRVAFITNGNIVALDTPQNLKEKNSNHRIVVSYLYQGKRKEQTIEAPELKAGIPFAYDEIISIHSQEPTLEDVFIQYTGRGLS